MEILLARKCTVNGKKAIFHAWSEISKVVPPSSMIGGHPGGVVKRMVAIIEYIEDGTVHECYPNEVRFTDNIIKRLINGDVSNEPVGMFGTIGVDYGRSPEINIKKLDSMKTFSELTDELGDYLRKQSNCTNHKWSPIYNSNDLECSICGIRSMQSSLKFKESDGE